ncbi:hypothetical protein CMV_013472 [Castanea mollissima]|uniref:ABC transporter domain-containing protein n=1 Tax=Castanea mollissima TaxID=60419 RepID=A0A8J4QZD4_9ROSI|nr:hypothetical protein CMV_013472 [Castanea mollissima]
MLRNNDMEVFTRSFRGEEDDEEALKWAALERLPTYSRMRKGMLTSAEGQAREIDIKSLGILERKALLDRLVKIAEEDNEKFLLKLKDRIDRVGLELPTVEVRFEHLNVEAEVYIGSRALPTIFNFFVNMLEGFLNYLHILPSRKITLPILRDVSGIIQPQRMTLLLGPPSSGKTTLLLALAGKLGKDLKFLGRVTYNGHGMEEFVPQRTSAYISQHDLHIGEMTVRETLTFAARCQGVGQRYEILAELLRREKAANIKPDPDIDIYMKAAALEGLETSIVTDYVIKILGLEVCADTIVGDEMLRGISGGQKKRLTTGEMLVGPARALFMDEISTGLDSSTTFQIVLGGFIISRDNVPKWWLWGYWISPLMYGQNAIAVNEFLGKSWRHVAPNSSEQLGVLVLKSRGIFPQADWYWIGVGALIGYIFLFNFLFTLALQYLSPFGKPQTVLSKEALTERNANRAGEFIELSSRGKSFPEQRAEDQRSLSSRSLSTRVGGIDEAYQNGKRGMVLPFEPLSIAFDEIRYAVDMPQEMKTQAPEVDSLTRTMFIEEVIELVELTSLREALVGLPNVSGLSTEQRKRLTIAVELVANPSIIFMDEPTSGLDARAAAIVMRTVRNTVDTGRTVVCTIHQPSIDIFDTFDELLLLKVGGEQIYAGPLGGHSSHLIKYFEEINGVPKIRDGYNPATWMLEVTSITQETALGVNFTDVYKNSELYRRNKALIRELSTPPLGSKELFFPTHYSQSFFEQCIACLWKQQCSYWRNPSYNAVRLLFTTIIALLFGMIFWDLGSKRTKQQDLFNAMGSMYTAVVYIGVQNGTSVQPVVATERTVFYRERAAGMYSALPYAIGQVVIELPYIFLQTVIYGVIVYAMMAFEWTVSKFLWYLFFMYFTLLYFTLYGMMTVALTPNHHIGSIVSSAFYAIWNLFSGFIVPQTRIPIWWRWYYWACPVAWTLYGLFASQYGDVKDLLESGETVEDFVRNYFGFRNDFLGVVAAVIVGIPVLFGFIFALSIKAFNFQKK